ncbi:MAG: hypothetical protein JJT78_08770 [Leptospira sp.]|nr:hypothetical protein [Leptospira sp.]
MVLLIPFGQILSALLFEPRLGSLVLAEVVVPFDLELLEAVPLVFLSMVWRILLCEELLSGFDDGVHTVLLVSVLAQIDGASGLRWGVTDWAILDEAFGLAPFRLEHWLGSFGLGVWLGSK